MYKKEKTGVVLRLILLLLLLLVLLFSVFQIVRHMASPPQKEALQTVRTVTYDGQQYYPRQDIDVLLVMGIDKYGPVEASNSYNNDGEADALILLVIDHTAESIHMLNINRDTMVEMPVLGVGGKQAGTTYGQVALSHTYGSGLEDSCENTVKAVSQILNAVQIDHYVAMHMDAIGLINDAVGGVTVEVTEDFSKYDSNIAMGEVTLQGQQAIDFVRYREGIGDELNVSRMDRQMQYMDGFFRAMKQKMEQGSGFALELYDQASDYMVTDCSATVLVSMLERYGDYELHPIQSLPGENTKGEEYMEFYPEKEAVDQLVLEMFYAPK